MTLYFAALIAGLLTVLSPCVLPVLPIILGSSATAKKKSELIIITLSLVVSVFIFTLFLQTSIKFTPFLQALGDRFWINVSGMIISIFGIITIFPSLWDKVSLDLNNQSHELLEKSKTKEGVWKPILLGASLGPVFTSCSPTYFIIIGLIASSDFTQGLSLLMIYLIGLGGFLYVIGLLGSKLTRKLGMFANPQSPARKALGVLFLILGIGIVLGWDKALETYLLDQGIYNSFAEFEVNLLN